MREEFRNRTLEILARDYGEPYRSRVLADLQRPDHIDIFGVVKQAGIRPFPRNAVTAAPLYVRAVDGPVIGTEGERGSQ